jgi:hypothetical protein
VWVPPHWMLEACAVATSKTRRAAWLEMGSVARKTTRVGHPLLMTYLGPLRHFVAMVQQGGCSGYCEETCWHELLGAGKPGPHHTGQHHGGGKTSGVALKAIDLLQTEGVWLILCMYARISIPVCWPHVCSWLVFVPLAW